MPHRDTHKAGILSGPIQSDVSGPVEGQSRPKQDARPEGRRATLRPKSLVLPREAVNSSPLALKSGVTAQSSAQDTPKSQRHEAPPTTPSSSATRLQRSASLRQPTTPRPKPTSAHSRHRSQVIGSEHKQAAAGGPVTPSRSKSPVKSTLQQHTSPRKPSIPTTPATTSTPHGDTTVGPGPPLSSQITSLQTEVLQLHILHSQALQAKAEWESSNEKHFQELHASAVATYHAVTSAEKGSRQRLNADAINQWRKNAKSNESCDFPEQIRLLSRVIEDVTDLTDTRGGRYETVVRRFERWFEHAMQVRRSRTRPQKDTHDGDEGDADPEMGFIDPLGDEWKEEVNALKLRLEPFARELDCLDVRIDEDEVGTDSSASALVRAVQGHKMMLASMLDELKIMPRIEKEVIQRENTWVRNAVDRVCQASHDELDSNDSAVDGNNSARNKCPIWAHVSYT